MRTIPTLILCLCIASIAAADPPESAVGLSAPSVDSTLGVAARVQAFYDRTDTLQARFAQSYWHALHRSTQRASGTLVLDQPGRMRFDYADGKVVASGGSYVTVYEPGEGGEPGQYAKVRSSEESLSSAFAFVMGTARIADDYHARLLDSARYGWRGDVLELRPRVADPRVRRILLYVDAREGLEGVVHRMRIDDHDGNRNTLTLSGLRFNVEVPSSRFAFNPPAGSTRMTR